MSKPRIAVICGGRSAFKSIHLLALEGYLCGTAIASKEAGQVELLEKATHQMELPFAKVLSRPELEKLEAWLDETQPDAVFSIGFPYLVPSEILEKLPGKFINFHHGPLPNYRGAMPIFEVLRSREKETAVTVHLMEPEFDEGPIVFTEPVSIAPNETFGSLAIKITDRTSIAVQNVAQMLSFGNNLPAFPQSEEEAEYFPKPEAEDTLINWPYMTAEEIVSLVNACNPWNTGADTFLNQRSIKIVSASSDTETHNGAAPGTILHLTPDEPVKIACVNNAILNVHIISNDCGIFPAHQLLAQNVQTGHVFKQ